MSECCTYSQDINTGQSLVAISVDSACAASLQCDIYIQREPNEEPILYRRKSHPLEKADLDRLIKRGIETIFISKSHEATYRDRMYEEVCCDETIAPAERFRVLRDINEAFFEKAFRGGKLDEVVGFSEVLGSQLTEIISRNDLVVEDLLSLMEFDNGTYTHCINVSTYCLLLATHLGISKVEELESIAAGALLHDIGKRQVQLSVLNKPGPLTDEQREHVQRHPLIGFEELSLRGDMNWRQLMIVYQHHERMDGLGYPTGISGDEIHPWARICSIADVFHALTSIRPYRFPLSVSAASVVIGGEMKTAFDSEMVKCWNTIMKTTPCFMA
ncbi:MAG: HD domain-containing protein [Pirellulales bacterium]|nr:HD domain-containing protein [Pirellulales bacterium]